MQLGMRWLPFRKLDSCYAQGPDVCLQQESLFRDPNRRRFKYIYFLEKEYISWYFYGFEKDNYF